MLVFTPRGLKIRLEVDWVFGLLARVWRKDPKTDAFRVLKTCEAIEEIPTVISLAAGAIAALLPGSPLWGVPLALVLGDTLGLILTQQGMFVILRPFGLLALARAFNCLPFYPALLVHGSMIGLMWWKAGWLGVGIWVGGAVAAAVMYWIVDHQYTKLRYRQLGHPITSSEVNFFNAYRLYADRLHVTRDVDVSEDEIAAGEWKSCLLDYAAKCPESAARFVSE